MTTSTDQRQHAVVIGASLGGLMAAGAASRHFNRVTVLERDQLPNEPIVRKGVPQGTQIHVILPIGLDYMEQVFPDIRKDFEAHGCPAYDELADIPLLTESGWRQRVRSANGLGFRRPVLEFAIRQRLAQISNVEIRHASVSGLAAPADRARITGVVLRDGTTIEADLVINATGRRTKVLDWLAQLGCPTPRETYLNAYMGYATQFVKIPDGALPEGVLGFVAPPWPGRHEGAALLPADNGVHALTAIGMVRNYPSRNRDEFLEFLEKGPAPQIAELARIAEPVSEINTYHQDGTLFRRWAEVDGLPDRFLAVGDSVTSLNPVYGQGMTLAAAASASLLAALSANDQLDGLASQVQKEIDGISSDAFAITAAADASFAGAEWSDDYVPPTDDEAAFALALDVLGTQSPEVALATALATYYIRPEEFESPELVARVTEWLAGPRDVPAYDARDFPRTIHQVAASHEPRHA